MPVSVKTRIGVTRANPEEWIAFLLSQGLSALTIHGRTVSQQSNGEADWSSVALAVRLRDQAGLPRVSSETETCAPRRFSTRDWRKRGRTG